ncbi:hypothetical protein CYMTET_29479 [Cymbomonas tetramitiformis]|uniref:Uncharacterized protein n=1 Tax=Cymbomonas tetramitiformis TaxID=36881 RepID=A0AAE0KV39_9CHLO|nr:hypothetical protein CYMTET_29479 [Cymbomonas tetramitiformis]
MDALAEPLGRQNESAPADYSREVPDHAHNHRRTYSYPLPAALSPFTVNINGRCGACLAWAEETSLWEDDMNMNLTRPRTRTARVAIGLIIAGWMLALGFCITLLVLYLRPQTRLSIINLSILFVMLFTPIRKNEEQVMN